MSDTTGFRRAALDATDTEVDALTLSVKSALEGDCSVADLAALADVAQFFGIEYKPNPHAAAYAAYTRDIAELLASDAA